MVSQSQRRIIITILFFLFFLWIAYPSRYYFLNDDFFHIPLAAQKVFVHGTLLRPLSDLSLWLDHLLWGKDAFGYHLTNIVIHLVNTLLVYILARQLFRKYGAWRGDGGKTARRESRERPGGDAEQKAWLAALFFLMYAFHSEPVFWIIGRGGSLTTLFFLAACNCYLRRDGPSRYFFFSLFFFSIGLFVYESIWVFPLVALFMSVAGIRADAEKTGSAKKTWGGEKLWMGERVYLMWIVGLFVVYLFFRYTQTGSLAGSYEARILPEGNSFRLLYNYNALFARSFLPPMARGKFFLASYACLLGLLGLGLLYIVKKRKPGVLLWLLAACFLISLLPAITLGIDTHNTESERFIYLPSVFCVLFLTEMIFLLSAPSGPAIWLLLLLIVLHAFQLRQASLSYQYAGRIARRSLEMIDADKTFFQIVDPKTPLRTLYVFHLPAQYEGALIFRSGFGPALEWIDTGFVFRRLVVLGKGELLKRHDSFSFAEQDLRQSAASLGVTIKADTAGRGWQINLPDTSFSFMPGKDRIFYWTDSSLVRVSR